jgi:hypothetical protein
MTEIIEVYAGQRYVSFLGKLLLQYTYVIVHMIDMGMVTSISLPPPHFLQF